MTGYQVKDILNENCTFASILNAIKSKIKESLKTKDEGFILEDQPKEDEKETEE